MIKKSLPYLFFLLSIPTYAGVPDTVLAHQYLNKAIQLIDSLDYTKAIILADSAINIYQTAQDTLPELGYALNAKGDALLEAGDYQQALAHYLQAKQILINRFGIAHAEVAQTFNDIGRCYTAERSIYQAAESFQQSLAIRLQLFGPTHEKVADCYNNLGNCALYLDALPEAYQYYGQALDIRIKVFGRQHADVASSLNNLGYCQMEVKNYLKAIELFSESLQIRTTALGNDHPKVTQSCKNIGDAYLQLNQLDSAFVYFDQAIAVYKYNKQENHPDLADIYHSLGNAYVLLGNHSQALSYFEKTLQIQLLHFSPDSHRLLATYNSLANTFMEQGDYNKALIYYQNNLQILHKNVEANHHHLAGTLNNIGGAYTKMGDYLKALENYNEALGIYTQLEDQHFIGVTYNNIGNCYLEGENFKAAIPIFKQSLAIFKKLYGENNKEIAPIYTNLGNCLGKEKKYKEAHAYYEAAIELVNDHYGAQHPLLAEYKTNHGTIHQREGHLKEALIQFDEAIAILKIDVHQKEDLGFMESPIPLINLLNAKAATLFLHFVKTNNKKELLEALALYEYTIQIIRHLRKQYQEEQSQRTLGEIVHSSFEGAIRTCYELFKLTGESNYMESAFIYSEQSRSSIMTEALNNNAAIRFTNIPDSLINKEHALKTAIAFYEKKLRTESRQTEKDVTLIDSYNNEVFAKKQLFDQLIQQFEAEYPEYFKLKYDDHILTIAETQNQLLSEKEALVEYFVADSAVYVFVINQQSAHFEIIPINLKELTKKVDSFRFGIYAPHTESASHNTANYLAYLEQYTQSAHFLYQTLWQPIENYLPERVTIIGGSLLNLLPFDALLSELPQQLNRLKTYSYLLKKQEISYGYSATLLHQVKNNKRLKCPKGLLAFAPHFLPGNKENFAPLNNNIPEVNKIQQFIKGETFIGPQATLQEFNTLAADYQIIHLATHGKSDEKVGDYSYLAFSSTKDSTEERLLYAKDIYNLPLNADMVVLSACETGKGELYLKGEGVISLGSAFFYAGAKSIIYTLWKVDDTSTKDLVSYFYQNIKEGHTKSAALRQAKIQYIEKGNQPHPYYWAAFIGNGDMDAIVLPSAISGYIYLSAFLGVIFLIWFLRKKR